MLQRIMGTAYGKYKQNLSCKPSKVIQFPKGDYLVVKGEAETAVELNNKLAGIAFGQVLPEAKNFAYVGGPNAMVEMGQRNGLVFGEMWIPVVRK